MLFNNGPQEKLKYRNLLLTVLAEGGTQHTFRSYMGGQGREGADTERDRT